MRLRPQRAQRRSAAHPSSEAEGCFSQSDESAVVASRFWLRTTGAKTFRNSTPGGRGWDWFLRGAQWRVGTGQPHSADVLRRVCASGYHLGCLVTAVGRDAIPCVAGSVVRERTRPGLMSLCPWFPQAVRLVPAKQSNRDRSGILIVSCLQVEQLRRTVAVSTRQGGSQFHGLSRLESFLISSSVLSISSPVFLMNFLNSSSMCSIFLLIPRNMNSPIGARTIGIRRQMKRTMLHAKRNRSSNT